VAESETMTRRFAPPFASFFGFFYFPCLLADGSG
jgi:hypothetical protein